MTYPWGLDSVATAGESVRFLFFVLQNVSSQHLTPHHG